MPARRARVLAASALWSRGTGTPFTPLAWWDATRWWLANWWVDLWLVLAAAAPTIFLAMLLFGLFQVRPLRYRGQRRLTARPDGAVRAVERGVTDNHGHTQWRSMADARKLFGGPHPLYGGIVVGEAYRVDHDRSIAGTRFDTRDERSWGMGGRSPLLIDPCTEGSGHSLVFAGPGGFKTTSAVSTVLTWIGSSVILDPSIELGPMLDGAPCGANPNKSCTSEIRALTEEGMIARNDAGIEGLVAWRKIRARPDAPVRLTYGYAMTVDTAQGSTTTEHIHAMPAGSHAIHGFKAYTAPSRHERTTWIVIDEAAERRQLASRSMIGHRPDSHEPDV